MTSAISQIYKFKKTCFPKRKIHSNFVHNIGVHRKIVAHELTVLCSL